MPSYPTTVTMARIYVKQGYIERAITIYQQLLQNSFGEEALRKEYQAVLMQRRKVAVLVRQWFELSLLYRQLKALQTYRNQSPSGKKNPVSS